MSWRYLGWCLLWLVAVLMAPTAFPARAQGVAHDLQAINRLTRLPETLELIRREGMAQGRELGQDLFDDGENPSWLAALDRIYDTGPMSMVYDQAFSAVLEGDKALLPDILPFLGSDLGQRIVALELEARRTTMDPSAMIAAQEILAELEETDKGRRDLIERLQVAADLVEGNVTSALNGNVAFYKALAASQALGGYEDEAELLAQARSQEQSIRANIVAFLYPVMALAYAPLSDQELQAYVAFAESPAGRRFNAALTRAFDPMMVELSRKLGAEAGKWLSGQML